MSVLVLAYNHGEYLADALDSILKQKVDFPFEVLIGEDCSEDDTLAIARRYEREHSGVIRVITSRSNVGMHENFRRLVFKSRGEFLAFCEGDDYWNSCDKLAQQVDYLRARPELGAVHSDFDHIVLVGGEWRALRGFWRHHHVQVDEGAVFSTLVRRNFIQTCTLVVRSQLARSYLESSSSDRYRVGDWPLCLHVSLRAGIGYIDKPLATYRRVEGSATNRGLRAEIERARDQFQMASDFCELAGADSHLVQLAHAEAMRVILDRAVRCGDAPTARHALTWLQDNGERFTGLRARVRRLLLSWSWGRYLVGTYANRRAADVRAYRELPVRPGRCS